ncbi:MAG TPA: response regulator transcription factor [Solirubrobacteraceae bacterium]|jgi:DNA-binding response OmpR family regulator|nr:response regulator transcription factor [Solirubrobacteraceae bacterium]
MQLSLSTRSRPTALRIAVLDNDSGFLLTLADRITRLGWKHRTLPPESAATTIRRMALDALIVDLEALGTPRWDWLEELCSGPRAFAVIVCTHVSTPAERVRALRLGADDWLGKPCHPDELMARVQAVARHLQRLETRDSQPICFGEVEIRPNLYQAFAGERSLNLTRRELQLMVLMVEAPGVVLGRRFLYSRIWGCEMRRDDRSVDVLVHKLRRKLAAGSPSWDYVHTHAGIGYSFAVQPLDGLAEARERRRRRTRAKVPLAA